MAITALSLVKSFIKGTAQRIAIIVIIKLTAPEKRKVIRSPSLILLNCLAPIFWPTNTERAAERVIAGSDAIESIRLAAVNPAITLVPNVLTMPINAIIPRATNVC